MAPAMSPRKRRSRACRKMKESWRSCSANGLPSWPYACSEHHAMATERESLQAEPAQRVVTLALLITCCLILVMAAWQIPSAGWIAALLCTVPLWATLAALLRQRTGLRAWPILCAIPYACFGVMELIANPAARIWAGGCALLGFALFAALALALRMRRQL